MGKRIAVSGNRVNWPEGFGESASYADFWNYLEMVFAYAGTSSLSAQLKPVSINNLRIGDVFIHGGFPGHAVIIVNMAENPQTGEKIFMLAQSYMPAQEIQVLTKLTIRPGTM